MTTDRTPAEPCEACGGALWKVPGATMSAFEEGGSRHRDHQWGDMQPGGPLWDREFLAQMYIAACMDRRGLLLTLDTTRAQLAEEQAKVAALVEALEQEHDDWNQAEGLECVGVPNCHVAALLASPVAPQEEK